MLVEISIKDDRSISCSSDVIGKENENKSTTLAIYLQDEMSNKNIFLEFEKANGDKFVSQELQILNNDQGYYVTFDMPNSLLDIEGPLLMEVVLRTDDNYVFKTYTFKFYVLHSINASEKVEEDNPDFISNAQKTLDETQEALSQAQQTLSVMEGIVDITGDGTLFLANDGKYKEVSGGTMDYDDLENKPITRIVSNDMENPYPLRDLQTGQYVLTGYFEPFKGASVPMIAMDVFTIVTRNENTSYIQMIFPFNNQIQYVETTDSSYIMDFISINELQRKMKVVKNTYSTTVTIQLSDRNSFQYTKDLKKITVNIPTNIEAGYNAQIVFNSGSTATEFIINEEIVWLGDDVSNSKFTPQANRYYTIDIWKDVNKTIAKVLAI